MIRDVEGAFLSGDPALVYQHTQTLIKMVRELFTETARLRFSLHFGTFLCDRCTGLQAGPGVAATCFQMRECHFGHLREGETHPSRRHLDVLARLTGDE